LGTSPRTTSNESAEPLLLFGFGFAAGQRIHLGAPFERDLPIAVVDDKLASVRLPNDLVLPGQEVEATVPVTLVSEDGAPLGPSVNLVIVNDLGFVDLTALVATPDLAFAFALSTFTDEVFALDTTTGAVTAIPVGDAPWALSFGVVDGVESIVVAHRYAKELRIIAARPAGAGARAQRTVPAPDYSHALAVQDGVAFVGEHKTDTLVAIDLKVGQELWRTPIDPNPQGIAVVGETIAVGSLVAGEVNLLERKTGKAVAVVGPRPGVHILRGHTESFGKYVIGGRGVRALSATAAGGLFVASAGPNVGPNPDKMSTSPCGGVGYIDGKSRSYLRHLAFDFGVAQALALDPTRGRLYVADVAEGLVHTVDANALAASDQKARKAWLSSVRLAPLPALTPVREDLSQPAKQAHPRAGLEVHTGPSGLALSKDGRTLLVLERFTGRITRLDVSGEVPRIDKSFAVADALPQLDRRRGQVLYFADVGRTGMSCDVCHLEGHGDGVFFTKTHMERIWRSPTVRGARDTPPYFNPPAHATLADTVSYVGSNNRFQNPPMSPEEVRLLTLYTAGYTTFANPYRDQDGGLLASVPLEGGRAGVPARGRRLFEARCAACHPPPLFSTDQDEQTRRRFSKLGTQAVLPIRVPMQDTSFELRTPPSLVGARDVWPMLLSGAAGFAVSASGNYLEVRDHSPIRAVLERNSDPTHGDAQDLSPQERADLEAFVLSL
jgi:mono/diheme cytochrome c family protein